MTDIDIPGLVDWLNGCEGTKYDEETSWSTKRLAAEAITHLQSQLSAPLPEETEESLKWLRGIIFYEMDWCEQQDKTIALIERQFQENASLTARVKTLQADLLERDAVWLPAKDAEIEQAESERDRAIEALKVHTREFISHRDFEKQSPMEFEVAERKARRNHAQTALTEIKRKL